MPHEFILLVLGVVGMGCMVGAVTEVARMRAKTGASGKALTDFEKRLARVEVALDDLTAAIGRVDEGQRFITRVLGERSVTPGER
jgi:hypothetical protein